MPAWYEFLCGPVTDAQVATIRAFLADFAPFGEAQAQEAARLFRSANRKRALRVHAMIAPTANIARARLATSNGTDFKVFVPFGLKLV